ncbi:UbiA family prenyltransferase [candidate division KSB1 bacterium]|nr:UbiA family prenyltransferase [candidate division KSB1 bacterium]
MTQTFLRLMDYFFVLRPTLFFPVWTVFMANYYAGSRSNGIISQPVGLWISVILMTMMMGASYIVNQIADIESDKKNQKLFIIADGYISVRNAVTELLILALIPFALTFSFGLKLGTSYLIAFVTTGIFYNIKPFSWKDRPYMGIVAHFLGGCSVAAAGWLATGAEGWGFISQSIPYGCGLITVYFLTVLPDLKGDAAANKITFGVKYGIPLSTKLALVAEIATGLTAWWVSDYVMCIPAALVLPLYVIAAVRNEIPDIIRATKYTILFTALAVCVVYPIYFAVLFVTYFFSKWYYRQRFNLEYPNMAA